MSLSTWACSLLWWMNEKVPWTDMFMFMDGGRLRPFVYLTGRSWAPSLTTAP